MNKFVKPDYRGKKMGKKVMDATCNGELTAYVKHSPTGAMIPVTTEAVQRMKDGERLDVEEAERKHDRFYFRLPFLAVRWGMDSKECLGKLMELGVPCFFNPNEVPINGNKVSIGQDDICIFKEYVDALEEKTIKKKKEVQPEYI